MTSINASTGTPDLSLHHDALSPVATSIQAGYPPSIQLTTLRLPWIPAAKLKHKYQFLGRFDPTPAHCQ
jgi:hypothetical protein